MLPESVSVEPLCGVNSPVEFRLILAAVVELPDVPVAVLVNVPPAITIGLTMLTGVPRSPTPSVPPALTKMLPAVALSTDVPNSKDNSPALILMFCTPATVAPTMEI